MSKISPPKIISVLDYAVLERGLHLSLEKSSGGIILGRLHNGQGSSQIIGVTHEEVYGTLSHLCQECAGINGFKGEIDVPGIEQYNDFFTKLILGGAILNVGSFIKHQSPGPNYHPPEYDEKLVRLYPMGRSDLGSIAPTVEGAFVQHGRLFSPIFP